jgi:hypothetical protein
MTPKTVDLRNLSGIITVSARALFFSLARTLTGVNTGNEPSTLRCHSQLAAPREEFFGD